MSTLRIITSVSTLRVTPAGQPVLRVQAAPAAVVRVSQLGLRGLPGPQGPSGNDGQDGDDGVDGEAQIPAVMDGGNF